MLKVIRRQRSPLKSAWQNSHMNKVTDRDKDMEPGYKRSGTGRDRDTDGQGQGHKTDTDKDRTDMDMDNFNRQLTKNKSIYCVKF